jgi:site-specific DNA recombinase
MVLRLPALQLPHDLATALEGLHDKDGTPTFAYARISQDREGAGLGIDRQLAEQMPLFARHGLRLAGVFADNDISAYSGKLRPDYTAMLAALAAGGARAVTCWHTDRLHRSVRELLDYIVLSEQRKLLTYGWRAGELDLSTPTGRATAITQTAWARQESEHKGDRVRAARQQGAQAGRYWGRRPYGFELDGATRADEADEIKRATEAVLAGASLRSILIDLAARGVRTASGKPWDAQRLREVLVRPRNAGFSVYRGEIVGAASWKPVVSEGEWRAVVDILTSPSRRTTTGNTVRWLGSGLYVCGACGQPKLRVSQSGSRPQPSYRCEASSGGKALAHIARNAVHVDALVEDTLVEFLSSQDAGEMLQKRDRVDVGALHAERLGIRQNLNILDDDLDAGHITRDRWLRRNTKLAGRIDEIDAELAMAGQVDPLAGIVGAPNVRDLWFGTSPDRSDGLDLGRRRAALGAVATVTILPARKPGRQPNGTYFDPDSVRIERKRFDL